MKTSTKETKMKTLTNIKQAPVFLHVESLVREKLLGTTFLRRGKYTVIIDYPLDVEYKFVVSGPMTAYDVCVLVAKEYAKIYRSASSQTKWGIWGHSIDDLTIGKLIVNHRKKVVTIEVGSQSMLRLELRQILALNCPKCGKFMTGEWAESEKKQIELFGAVNVCPHCGRTKGTKETKKRMKDDG